MKKVCAWCSKLLQEGTGEEGEKVSHGMCEDCATQVKNEMKWREDMEHLQKYSPKRKE